VLWGQPLKGSADLKIVKKDLKGHVGDGALLAENPINRLGLWIQRRGPRGAAGPQYKPTTRLWRVAIGRKEEQKKKPEGRPMGVCMHRTAENTPPKGGWNRTASTEPGRAIT